MLINLKSGIDKLLFGMKHKDVITIYGPPDKEFLDEEKNSIYLYNQLQFRLTFYQDEDMRLGYIISSNPNLELFSQKIMHQNWEKIKEIILKKGILTFEKESFDATDNYFNEANWMIFQTEFGQIKKFELGAIINHNDDFEWKFKG